MDISEIELMWILGGLLVLTLLTGYHSLMAERTVLREQRALGKLYWYWRTLLEMRTREKP